MSRYAILDSQWNVIKDHMPGRIGTKGVTAKDNRLFFDALIHMARAGCPWRDGTVCSSGMTVGPNQVS